MPLEIITCETLKFTDIIERKSNFYFIIRYGIMEKLKRLQAGEDVSELLAEIDDEMGVDEEEEEEDYEDYGLTEVQKKVSIHFRKLCNCITLF